MSLRFSRLLIVSCAIALWLLGVAGPAAAQAPADDRFAALHTQRLQAAELTLSQATSIQPVVVPHSEPQALESLVLSEAVPAWARGLSSAQWELMVESFKAESVPVELLAVGWVESRFNPTALSPKGARGVWQFMPETARRYGLQVGDTRDDRTDLALSTRAAARHLADLYRQFGDWPLALAAYNAGADRIEAAITRAGSRDFSSLRPSLPAETRDYVPAVLRASGRRSLAAGPVR
ncbi:MAG: lytic transglycosylase domain-containing protein [Candidatus Acidiferrales bacterium]